jgi:hypothetical protein
MERQEIMEALAEHYEIEPDENGEYDIEDYDWQAGCYTNGKWMSLAEIVKIMERYF